MCSDFLQIFDADIQRKSLHETDILFSLVNKYV